MRREHSYFRRAGNRVRYAHRVPVLQKLRSLAAVAGCTGWYEVGFYFEASASQRDHVVDRGSWLSAVDTWARSQHPGVGTRRERTVNQGSQLAGASFVVLLGSSSFLRAPCSLVGKLFGAVLRVSPSSLSSSVVQRVVVIFALAHRPVDTSAVSSLLSRVFPAFFLVLGVAGLALRLLAVFGSFVRTVVVQVLGRAAFGAGLFCHTLYYGGRWYSDGLRRA
jgi:hypothetical protein